MHAYQFYIPAEKVSEGRFNLEDAEFRHCCRVLRKHAGDTIDIFDGQGRRWSARIETITKTNATCQVLTEYPLQPPLNPALMLGVGLLKSSQIEELVLNATALNVSLIAFLRTLHSVKNSINRPRLEKLSLSAVKQSGQAYLPQILSLSWIWFQLLLNRG
jgi:16S rRNA (uracil1498-N3)-methyltransferase